MDQSNRVRILHPGIEAVVDQTTPAAAALRLSRLDGARIALIDNSKPNARELLLEVARLLGQRVPGLTSRIWRKQTSAMPAPFLQELLAWRADAVLNGIGD